MTVKVKEEQRQLLQRRLDRALEKLEHLDAENMELRAENKRLIIKNNWLEEQAIFTAQADHARARNSSWGGNNAH
jgi:hypothetical protein